ncbi:hypothetical protein HDU97_002408 [Phlyctochytrium planicorne]|nr:hypothetical protein HDU97_002408 [Phlyctochytrium planicorne]
MFLKTLTFASTLALLLSSGSNAAVLPTTTLKTTTLKTSSTQSPTPTPPPKITKIVVFGDQMSDTGRAAAMTKNDGGLPALSPNVFWNNRYSNGPIWIDTLTQNLTGVTVENYAVGGASTTDKYYKGYLCRKDCDKKNMQVLYVPSVETQIKEYLAKKETVNKDNILYIVYPGNNDWLRQPYDTPPFKGSGASDHGELHSQELRASWEALAKAGAKNLLVLTLPNVLIATDMWERFFAYTIVGDLQKLKTTYKNINTWTFDLTKTFGIRMFELGVTSSQLVVFVCVSGWSFFPYPPAKKVDPACGRYGPIYYDGTTYTSNFHQRIATDLADFLKQKVTF